MDSDLKWTVVECSPDQTGADAVRRAYGLFATEDDALAFLADIRDDNPDTGDGWTTAEVRMDLSINTGEV